jgi:hypothetical protein
VSAAPLEAVQKLADAQDAEIERLTQALADAQHALERIQRAAVQFHGDVGCEVAQGGFEYIRALSAKARKGAQS